MAINPFFVKDPSAITQEEWFEVFVQKVAETIHRHMDQSESEDISDLSEEIGGWFHTLIEGVYRQATPATQERFRNAFAHSFAVLDYLNRIRAQKLNILKLAMHHVSDKIYVWAEINDEDIKTKDALMGIEATINATYLESSDKILETMIVEKGDNLAIPNHYKQVI